MDSNQYGLNEMTKKGLATKENMEDIRKSTGMSEIESGNVVATVWPTSHKFKETEKSVKDLTVKYSHLKQLDPENKETYKELTLAIADMRTRRTDNTKEETAIKGPINIYLTMIRDSAKKLRALIGTEEERLKAEKTRIDDIIKENKLAMQKLWQDNINSVTSIIQTISAMDREQLAELLDAQNSYDFESLDFGEFIDQAKSAVAQNVIAISERIDFLAEQERLANERLWNDNLNIVRNWASNVGGETDEGLRITIDRLEAFDLSTMEFGDLLQQAGAAFLDAQNRALLEDNRRTNARIEKIKQKAADDKRKKEDAERKEKEAADQKKRDDEKAAADKKAAADAKELQDLKDEIAAMKKDAEPAPEPVKAEEPAEEEAKEIVFADNGDDIEKRMETGDYSGSVAADLGKNEETVLVTQEGTEVVAVEKVVDWLDSPEEDTPAPEQEKTVEREEEDHDNLDSQVLQLWSNEIRKAQSSMTGFVLNERAKTAVKEVYDQMEQLFMHLDKVAESLR